jgi:hypothetical protein
LSAEGVPDGVELDPGGVVPVRGVADVAGVSADEDVEPRGEELPAAAEVVPGSSGAVGEPGSSVDAVDTVDVGSAVATEGRVTALVGPVGHSVPAPTASC